MYNVHDVTNGKYQNALGHITFAAVPRTLFVKYLDLFFKGLKIRFGLLNLNSIVSSKIDENNTGL